MNIYGMPGDSHKHHDSAWREGQSRSEAFFETKSGLSSDHKQRETTSCRLQRDSPGDESGAC